MRGTIQKRGTESWRVKAYVGRDSTGTKRYVSRTVRGTRRDAERELSRLLVEVDEGRFVASPAMTLDDLLDRWLEVKRQHVEPSTWSNYEWIARKYIRPALGDRSLALRTARAIFVEATPTLDAALKGRVADWWLPDRIISVPTMPLAATGKIDKTELRAVYGAA